MASLNMGPPVVGLCGKCGHWFMTTSSIVHASSEWPPSECSHFGMLDLGCAVGYEPNVVEG